MKKHYLLRLALLIGLLGGGLTRPLAWAQVTPDISTTLTATPTPVRLGVTVTNVRSGITIATVATIVARTVTGLPTGLSGLTFGGTGTANATCRSGAGSMTIKSESHSSTFDGASPASCQMTA